MGVMITDSSAKTKILRAIVEDPEIVLLLKEKYVDNEIWQFSIEREPNLFRKMKNPSDEICLFACSVDGSNLKYIKNKFHHIKITPTMCLTAVKSNPKAILYIPKSMMNDELKEIACYEDPSLMSSFDDLRPEFIERIIKEKPYSVRYVKRISESFLCEMIKTTPAICTYFDKMTPKMLETFKEYHPNYFHLYKNNLTSENVVGGTQDAKDD